MSESPKRRQNPYVGPIPFEEADADVFYGRPTETQRLLDLLLAERIVLLYSPSGAGKTSLIKAGLIPRLREERFHLWPPVRLNREPPIREEEDGQINRYVYSKLLSLALAFAVGPELIVKDAALDEFFSCLSAHTESRYEMFVFDQFEEILSLDYGDVDAKEEWIREIGRILKEDHRWALFAMREDYIAALEPYLKWIPTRLGNTFRLDLLRPNMAQQAVQKPASVADVDFGGDAAIKLVNNLRGATGGERGSPYVEPVLLQVVCKNLFETLADDENSINEDTLERLGSIDSALSDYYSESIAKASKKSTVQGREIRDWFEDKLITSDGIRRQIQTGPGKDSESRKKAVRSLVESHLVRTEERLGADWLELAHDRLVEPIIRNNAKWRDENLEPFQQQAIIWDKEGRPDSRYLLERKEFATAKNWISTHSDEAGNLEQAFVGASKTVLEKRFWKRASVIVAASLLAAVVIFEVVQVFALREGKKQSYYELTEGRLESIATSSYNAARATREFENVADYLLFQQSGPEHLDKLKELLQRYESLLPPSYGIELSGDEALSTPTGDWPLELHYSARRDLDQTYFNSTWQDMARFFTTQWGLPVPKRLKIAREPDYPRRLMTLGGRWQDLALNTQLEIRQTTEILEINAPDFYDGVFISVSGLGRPGWEFFERFRDEWQEIEQAAIGGPWYIVPRWSLPAWRVSRVSATNGGVNATNVSGLPAFLLALELQKNPKQFFQDAATDFLLNRFSTKYRQTVAEARAARGARLHDDLVELVRLGSGMRHLHLLLDALARYPNETSEQAAHGAFWDVRSPLASLPNAFHGPWNESPRQEGPEGALETAPDEPDESESDVHQAYKEIADWLPPVEPELRVYVGQQLGEIWFPNGELHPRLSEKIEILRDSFLRDYGVNMPVVRFRTYDWDPTLDTNSIRIVMFNQDVDQSEAIRMWSSLQAFESIDELIDELDWATSGLRIYLLNAENIHSRLQSLTPSLRQWLEKRYSLTDLKLLLRAVTDQSLSEYVDPSATGYANVTSLRHFDWLLGSLVFWTNYEDSGDVRQLAQYIQETEAAYQRVSSIAGLHEPNGAISSGLTSSQRAVAKAIDEGVQALANGRVAEAHSTFARAVSADSKVARSHYLATYPATWKPSIRNAVDEDCGLPLDVDLDRTQRVNLEDLLWDPNESFDSQTDRRLTLCLFYNTSVQTPGKRDSLADELLRDHGDTEGWPPDEAAWFAQTVLSEFNSLKHSSQRADRALELLSSALTQLDEPEGNKAFWKLVEICNRPGPYGWCWPAAIELAGAHQSISAALELTYQLSYLEEEQQLELALEWADRVTELIERREAPPETRQWQLDYAKFARVKAQRSLADIRREHPTDDVEEAIRSLLESPAVGQLAAAELAGLLLSEDRFEDAQQLLERSIEEWPDDVDLYAYKIWSQLLTNDKRGAADTAIEVLGRAGINSGTLYLASVAQIVTQTGRWEFRAREFLETEHEYVPYIAMMVYAYMGGDDEEAAALLDDRWQEIQQRQYSWNSRVRAGDATAWRDMLIGHYLGHDVGDATFSEIIEVLENEQAFTESDYSFLPMSRTALLCEAYFYDAMLAKAKGDTLSYRANLKSVVETNRRQYYEHTFATFLLNQEINEF